MAKGKLTELEQVYIKYNSDKMTVAEIAKKLGRTTKIVEREIESTSKVAAQIPVVPDLPSPPPKISEVTNQPLYQASQVEGLFARREGITMMTPNAAQACDEVKDVTQANIGKYKNSVTSIKKKT